MSQQVGGSSGFLQLSVLGTSFKSSDIGFRENLARVLGKNHLGDFLASVEESALISTCNRYELYLVSGDPAATYSSFLKEVGEQTGVRDLESAFYEHSGTQAVRHLFRVAAGLESVVVGEPQILAQVRAAGIASRREGKSRGILSPLFDRAYRVGSHVRASYGLGSGEASLGDLAVEAVNDMMPGRYEVMLIGTGKMVQVAARRLKGSTRRFYVASRRRTAPAGLEGCTLIRYSDIGKYAPKCDVIISATDAERPILGKGDLNSGRRRVVVDLGMPRNVSPSVRDLPNVRLLDLDDLARLARPRKLSNSLKKAEAATSKEASEFYDWLVQTRLSSTLADLYTWANDVRQEELRRAVGRLRPMAARETRILDAMGRRIVSKLMSRPAKFARSPQTALSEEEKLELLRSVFGMGAADEG